MWKYSKTNIKNEDYLQTIQTQIVHFIEIQFASVSELHINSNVALDRQVVILTFSLECISISYFLFIV